MEMSIMRLMGIVIVLTLYGLLGCEAGSSFETDFGTSHLVVEGRVTQLPSSVPVGQALVLVGIRELNNCANPPWPFHLMTGADGTFGSKLEMLSIPGERACVTFDVRPPGSNEVQRAVVTVENVRVLAVTSPPDTLRVTISLPTQ